MTSDPARQSEVFRQLVDRFQARWQSQMPPQLEVFFREALGTDGRSLDEAARRGFLEELVKLDLEYRWKSRPHGQGGTVTWLRLEDYVARLPELGPVERLPLDL